jgi:uncharacterized protein (UPF0335 family)
MRQNAGRTGTSRLVKTPLQQKRKFGVSLQISTLIGPGESWEKGRTSLHLRKMAMVEDSVAQDQLRAFIERIERMEEEKASIANDIKEIYAEAKGNGFDTKILRQIVRIRKQDHNERMEQEAILELYMQALGMATAPRESEAA